MSARHISRVIAMQTMYELDITDSLNISTEESKKIVARNIVEFGGSLKESDFTEKILAETLSRLTTLDEIIQKAAPEWPMDKINIVDRNVLRVGLCELLFGDREHVPPKVAIDEAIEIAKEYGGESSGRFVNGVLGAVYKEMGEPGKGDVSAKPIQIEELIGVIVTSTYGDKKYVGMVHDIFGHWTLCKSHKAEGESVEAAVARVVKKEFGILDAKIIEKIGENAYVAHHPEKGKVRKQVEYYLARTAHEAPKVEDSKGLDEAKWWRMDEVSILPVYEDMRPTILRALEIIKNE
jgi:N utilization substance protein B